MGHTACTEAQCLYKGDLYLFLPYKMNFYLLASEHRNIFCDTTVHTKGSKT